MDRRVQKRKNSYKPKYGMFSCVRYIYKLLWNTERGLVFTGIFNIPISLIFFVIQLRNFFVKSDYYSFFGFWLHVELFCRKMETSEEPE